MGGQVIDTHDSVFSQRLAPLLLGQTYSKSHKALGNGGNSTKIYPLRFSFCENWQTALPLSGSPIPRCGASHPMEGYAAVDSSVRRVECHANYVYLDTEERELFASQPMNLLITQVQKAISSGSKMQELNFNHPIKFLAASNVATDSVNTATNRVKLQINGTDVTDYKFIDPHYTTAASYYHAPHAMTDASLYTLPFCLDTSRVQPTGSLNFSRLDSARIVSETASFKDTIYAVNYNILRIENGMGGLMYSN